MDGGIKGGKDLRKGGREECKLGREGKRDGRREEGRNGGTDGGMDGEQERRSDGGR